MDIPPISSPPVSPAPANSLREGVLLLKGLMNNQVALAPEKSLLVELISHLPLATSTQANLNLLANQKIAPLPSWQPLLTEAPLELLELKLPSGQKIWAAALRSWFETTLAQLPAKSLIELKTSKDGQLLWQPPVDNSAKSVGPALPELWRKYLPIAQSPKQLMQLMAPLVKPLSNLPSNSSHPVQHIQQFMLRQGQNVNSLLNLAQSPPSELQKSRTSQLVTQLIANSGVFLEGKLRTIINPPEGRLVESLSEIITHDFKAQILKALFAINQLTPDSVPSEEEWPDNLWHLFLGNKEGASTTTAKNGNWLLLETLLPSLQKTLAGIQLQQTHSLAEQAKNTGAMHFDLPLPSAEGWINLSAQLIPMHNTAVDEDSSSEQQARAMAASWRLLLEFNLPQNGLLAVQFLWQPGMLRGKVWANQPKLKQSLKEQLKQLKESLQQGGIDAEQLHISDEPITKPSPPINHPLVDIQT
ncbi:MAG TPA: flagellar hook-length control protein FliK [Cellvibrionaceae bacterium]